MAPPPFTEEAVKLLATVFVSASGSVLQPAQVDQVVQEIRKGFRELMNAPDAVVSPEQKEELSRFPALLDQALYTDRVATRDPPSDQVH